MFIVVRIGDNFAESGWPNFCSNQGDTLIGTSVLYHGGLGIAIPVHAWTGPEGARRLRLPDFKTAREGGKVANPMPQLPLPPRKYSWYPFLLEAESTPGPYCCRIMLMKSSGDTIGNRTCSLSACSAVPHPTAPPCAPP